MRNMTSNAREGGAVSEWNEGNLKNLRLHEAQELINIGKIDPIKREGNWWNYQSWISGIEILYGEGHSKYSDDEIKEIEKLRKVIEGRLFYYPPFKILVVVQLSAKKKKYELNYSSWKVLKRLIELYEQKVKLFNDKHGLSTRNYDYDDEGL